MKKLLVFVFSVGVALGQQQVGASVPGGSLASQTSRAAGAGAVLRSGQDKLNDTLSALDYGMDNTGVREITAAFNAVMAVAAPKCKPVYFPAGTYKISVTAGPKRPASCVSMLGDNAGGTIFLLSDSTVTNDMFWFINYNNAEIANITFDLNNRATTSTCGGQGDGANGYCGVIRCLNCYNVKIHNNILKNWDRYGIIINNIGADVKIEDNLIFRVNLPGALGFDQNISAIIGTGGVTQMKIRNNHITNTGIFLDGNYNEISDNMIETNNYSSCFANYTGPNTYNNVIKGNTCPGTNANSGQLNNAIETWGSGDQVINNHVFGWTTDGISIGGMHSIVADNYSHDNGSNIPGAYSGFVCRVGTAPYGGQGYNCSYSTFSNNKANNIATPATQGYGIRVAKVSGVYPYYVSLVGNDFHGNATAPVNLSDLSASDVMGSLLDEHRPQFTGCAAWTPGTISAGSQANTAVSLAGAQMGSTVATPSFSIDVGLAVLVGSVSANNTVQIVAWNHTGSPITINAGTVCATVQLPRGYASY